MNTIHLPNHVLDCIHRLEQAGFAAYAVGGCVRDALLGLTPQDYDLCTSALPEQIKTVFSQCRLVLAGEKHGTVGVVTGNSVVEITTFRTEGTYTDNRHPDWVQFVPHIKDDLARRDFTVNAMAYSPDRGFEDPFGGLEDLKSHTLRAVGQPEKRFQEDALRILRGVRFAVRYQLSAEPQTASAMFRLAALTDHLAKERVFEELCKLIVLVTADDLRRFAPILGTVIPELAATFHFDQHCPHHAYDVFEHTIRVTAGVPGTLELRWAALFHDIGKVPTFRLDENRRGHFNGHAQAGAKMADQILHRMKAPSHLRRQVVLLINQHMNLLEPDRMLLCRRINQYGAHTVRELLLLQKADFYSKGLGLESTVFDETMELLNQLCAERACLSLKDLAVNGKDLMKIGFQAGPSLGRCLDQLLEQVLEQKIPNNKSALLQAASQLLSYVEL